jgi:predicted nucleic-acid-binding protein
MPTAIDTNVLVRFLIDDGSEQVATARAIFDAGMVSIPVTVMLETEWVLRSAYGISRSVVCDGLTRLLNMETVTVADADAVERAVGAHRDGADFADALHVFTAHGCERFATFDTDLLRKRQLFTDIELVHT